MKPGPFASIAAFFGALAVMLGAFGAHGIKDRVSPANLAIWQTGAHYHLIHAVALLALALFDQKRSYQTVCILWLAGITIFSGSLYALAVTDIKILGAITPLGGLCLIIGWIILGIKLLKPAA